MIDLDQEELCLLANASPHVPGRPHPSTLVRWASVGFRGVRLETVKIGWRRYTSVEAIRRFLTRLNEGDAGPPPGESRPRTVQKPVPD